MFDSKNLIGRNWAALINKERSWNMTILVVDDQENMCWILSKVLLNAGFSVKTAGTVKEACSIANDGGISAAVIDFRLPDGNGLDLLAKLRKPGRDLPCILITSYGSKKLREEAFELGFDSYFDKPFDNNALVVALRKSLKVHKPNILHGK
jgi:two-component system response regulator AtoC